MAIKISLFITLALYAIVVSQSLFYILAMSNVMKNMQPATYIESRKLLDRNLRSSLSGVYYLALAASCLLTAFCVTNPSGILFICTVIALVALVADITLALKGNIPLNDVINSWTAADYPANWQEYRSKWFSVYNIRQAANIIGFVSLLVGLVFGL
ncbi:MAG: hypothetical protein JNK14_06890 [Chitinophagaceae bacterium]|nr:hypothetical protein [Chitinophagaceae bacterium]